MATVFVPREADPLERRVAATPETVRRFVRAGYGVAVEEGAGARAFFPDAEYVAAGAALVASGEAGRAAADLVVQLDPPTPAQAEAMKEGASLVSFLWAPEQAETVRVLVRRRISAFALDALPRTTRAQKDDALTSQASLAGYKAVLLAATHLPRIFPLQMTPAGTLRPAKVLVLGAGVAGLQAVATARRLGAIVEVSDVRLEVKEQVQSLGATYLEVAGPDGKAEVAAGVGGYAAEQGEDFRRRQRELLEDRVAGADVVITTALVPYRPAPRLVADAMVARMRPGSVIVDLAAERGGNVEGTVPGETTVRHGVTLIGAVRLASTVPAHASDQYAKNVLNVVLDATKAGGLVWDLADEVVAGALVVHRGEVRHPRAREALGLPPEPPPVGPHRPESPSSAPPPPGPSPTRA